jgi:hypothetical protein
MSLILDGTNGLSDVDGSAATPAIRGTDTNTGMFFPAADTIAFAEGGAEVVRIDSSGNVGIGTTSPTFKTEIVGGANTVETILLQLRSNHTGTNTGTTLAFANSTNPTAGSGRVELAGLRDTASGSSFVIRTADSSGTIQNRVRINESGNLLVGATSTVDSERLNVTQSGQFPIIYANNTNTSNAYGIRANLATYFFNTTSFLFDGIEFSNLRFRVYSNGGIANYSGNDVNLSDEREKKDITLAPNYLDKICQIPVKTFLYINQTDTQKTLGVIAQDVQAIAHELVDETDWSENGDGSKMRLSIYQTDLQFALMKAIQELKAIVDAQAIEINELKAKP